MNRLTQAEKDLLSLQIGKIRLDLDFIESHVIQGDNTISMDKSPSEYISKRLAKIVVVLKGAHTAPGKPSAPNAPITPAISTLLL